MSATSAPDVTILPIAPNLFWALVVFAGIALASLLVTAILPREPRDKVTEVERIQDHLGLSNLNGGVFFFASLLWLSICLLLTAGLLWFIWQSIWATAGTTTQETWDFRFLLAQLVALTGVLGAVIALPFTLVRLRFTRQQTETAEEQTRHNDRVLFNQKFDAAAAGLHAQRQITIKVGREHRTIWQDDMIRRNGAMDRLEELAQENPTAASRVARMLSVYVRELSREFPAEPAPTIANPEVFLDWLRKLEQARVDMEKAVHSLGRLQQIVGASIANGLIDLREANLQSFALDGLCFDKAKLCGAQMQRVNLERSQMRQADLSGAQMQGANIDGAQMQGSNLSRAQMQWASLVRAQMQRAVLSETQLQGSNLNGAQMQGAELHRTQLQQANLEGVQMQGASLLHAQIQGAVLAGVQMQGADLGGVQMRGTILNGAQMQGVLLRWAGMDATTSLSGVSLRGAALRWVDFSQAKLEQVNIDELFGDITAKLPSGIEVPERFCRRYETDEEFFGAWRAWQASIGFDPDDPSIW